MMHPNKIHFCAINKRCVTEFRLLSDKKNPILLLLQILAMSFKHHLQMSSLSMFACCGQATEIFVGKQYPLQGNIVEWVYVFANTAAEKIYIRFLSPGLTACHRSVCHAGSVTFVPVFLAFYLVYVCLSKYYFVFFYSCHLLFSSE